MNLFWHALLAINEEIKDITSVGETLAYTWFGRPNWAYSETAQKYWIGSTKDTVNGTTQHITEYDIDTDTYFTTQVGTVFQKDDHNQSQILIRESDKRILAFYVEHNGSALRWKISTNPLDASSFGAEKTVNPVASYSYISPYQASNGNIFIFFRSYVSAQTAYIWHYMKSTDGGETFGNLTVFFNNGSVQPYLIYSQNGDKLHFAASNGHPQSNAPSNINVFHFYFDLIAETLHKSNTDLITLPAANINMTQATSVLGNDTTWILDISFKNNFPRIIYAYYPSGITTNFITKELWFIEYDGTSWVNNQKISDTMVGYIEDDASIQEKCYTGASRFDTSNSDIIWMPKQVNGILEIHKVDLRNNPIYIEQITFDSTVNNWRPISVPSPVNNLLWLKNNDYNMYNDYSITLQTKTVPVN